MMIITNKYTFANGDRVYKPRRILPTEKPQEEKDRGRIIKTQVKNNYSTREWTV